MNLTSSVFLFAIFLMAYSALIEVFTVLLQMTGITREKARTQAISLLTNSGFTTHESEVVMQGARRRRLVRAAMLCGYSFAVVIVSVLVNFFLTLNRTEIRNMTASVLIAAALVTAYVLVIRLPRVRGGFDRLIERLGSRAMLGEGANVLLLIDVIRGQAMVEAHIEHVPPFLVGKPLGESQLKQAHNIQILYLKRADQALDKIDGQTEIQKGDSLLLFGDYRRIRTVFERPGTP